MLFKYKAINDKNETREGTVEAQSRDLAITSLQRRALVVLSIQESGKRSGWNLALFEKVPAKDVVIISRQIATLFEAQVSALKAFTLLATGVENPLLKRKLGQITEDLQAGFSISAALGKHPDIFSDFYVNLVKAGEESGKLMQTFSYLADYLDRQYELTSKTKNALIYPAFIVVVFIGVMVLMFVMIIPKLSAIIREAGTEVPFYTKIVMGLSDFLVNYGIFVGIFVVVLGVWLSFIAKTERFKAALDNAKIKAPAFGDLFRKLYLARIADNLDTMLSSGISIVRAIDITGQVVGNRVYAAVLKDAVEAVKAGRSFSEALEKHPQIPAIMVQMVKVGEETGSLASILKTLGKFYTREVNEAVDTLVGLIEPVMIVVLAVGVGFLLAAVLVPIYNVAGGIQ